MSYIDQDALLERIDGIYDCNDMRFEPNDKCCTVPDDCKGCKWAETKRAIRKIVENMPVADVRPVKRGKWTMHSDYPDRLICSECGTQFDVWHWEAKQMHFCPNCGARMEES